MRQRGWYLDLDVLLAEIEQHEAILGRKVCCYSDFPYWLHSAVWRYIKHNNIPKLKNFLNSINRDSDYEIVSLCGHYTTSLAELIVCNFLHLNNVPHEFNRCLPNSKLRYDHKIEIDGLTLYLEQTLYQKENVSKRCVRYFEKWNKKQEYYKTNSLNYLFLGREYFETSINIIDKKLKHILSVYIKNIDGIYEPYQLLSHSQYNLETDLKEPIVFFTKQSFLDIFDDFKYEMFDMLKDRKISTDQHQKLYDEFMDRVYDWCVENQIKYVKRKINNKDKK